MNGKLKWLFFRRGFFTEGRAKKNRWSGQTILGKNFNIGKKSILDRYMGGTINIGNSVTICQNCKIAICGGNIDIGDNSTLGDYTTITAQGGVSIGSNVLFADHISLVANEHNYKNHTIPIMYQGCVEMPIIIGNGSWIGINATLLSGTVIGENSVVAAGAVVKGNFPDYCVIGGVPARILKQYYPKENVWR